MSPLYTGRTTGGLPLAETSRLKTLADHVHDWQAFGQSLWTPAGAISTGSEPAAGSAATGDGGDRETAEEAEAAAAAAAAAALLAGPPPVRQPAPAPPFLALRFMMGTRVPPPPASWAAASSADVVTVAAAGGTKLPSARRLAAMVAAQQWGALEKGVPPASTLIAGTDSHDVTTTAPPPPGATLERLSVPQLLLYCRARVAALLGVRLPEVAAREVGAVVAALLHAMGGAGWAAATPPTRALLAFAVAQWLLHYGDALTAAGAVAEGEAVYGTVAAHLAAAADGVAGGRTLVPPVVPAGAYAAPVDAGVADAAQAGRLAVLTALPHAAMANTALSLPTRAAAALQHAPVTEPACLTYLLTAAEVRRATAAAAAGLRSAPTRLYAHLLARLRGGDHRAAHALPASGQEALACAAAYAGAALPATAASPGLVAGAAWFHAAAYFAAMGAGDARDMAVAELGELPGWREALEAARVADTADIGGVGGGGGGSGGTGSGPANAATGDRLVTTACAFLLHGRSRLRERLYEAAQRSLERALAAAAELACPSPTATQPSDGGAPSTPVEAGAPPPPEYSDTVFMTAADLLVACTLAVVMAATRRGAGMSCVPTLLDALLRSDVTRFARPDVVATLSAAYDLSAASDAMVSVRNKRVLQAVCHHYAMDHLDTKLFRLPGV